MNNVVSAEKEIEVTPEMIRAGDYVLMEYDPLYDSSEDFIRGIFRAMVEAQRAGMQVGAGQKDRRDSCSL